MHDGKSREPVDPDESLGALYALTRDAAHTPPLDPALDARILAAAREAAGPPRTPLLHYVRWASAAVLVLAIGLVWRGGGPTMQDGMPSSAPQGAAVPATRAAAQAAQPSIEFYGIPVESGTPANDVLPQAPRNRSAKASQESRVAAKQPSSSADNAPQAVSAGAVVPALADSSSAEPAELDTQQQLEAIRRLQAEGRHDEARAALTRLRAQFPELVLDEDLRALLDPAP